MSLRGFVVLFLGLPLVFTSLEAQIRYPGGTPYPTGGPYPGGPYPGGSGGPYPGGGGGRGGRSSEPSRSNRGRKDAAPTITTTGMLRLVGGSQFALEADDHRIITYKTTGSTKVQKNGKTVELKDLDIGDHFTVDATSDDEGFFTATAVTFNLAGTAADREAASRTWDLPTLTSQAASSASRPAGSGSAPSGAPRSGGDDDRPILRRGKSDADTANNTSAQPANAPASTGAPLSSGAPATATAKPPEQAPEDVVDTRPTTLVRPRDPAPDADDPGKPALRRGRPVARPRAVPVEPETVAGATAAPGASSQDGITSGAPTSAAPTALSAADAPPPVIGFEDDPIIRKAKEAAEEYSSALPDFFCHQVTTRYQTDGPKNGWQALDVVTADVSYEGGRETYKNIKIGNKAVNSDMGDIPGTRSTGEFASILQDLFAPDTAATFRKSGQSKIRGRTADTYKFEVKRENSHWRIVVAAQLYYPAFRGTVWIDRETARVLRIEMEGRNMPLLFPFDKVESATDYDFVRLSSPQQFLMPVNAEVLSCEQGSSTCLRNRIEFRNYRKFGADSDITFDN